MFSDVLNPYSFFKVIKSHIRIRQEAKLHDCQIKMNRLWFEQATFSKFWLDVRISGIWSVAQLDLQEKDVKHYTRNTAISLIIWYTGEARDLLAQDKVELLPRVQTQAVEIMSTVLTVSHNFSTALQLPTSGTLHWSLTVTRVYIIVAVTELNFNFMWSELPIKCKIGVPTRLFEVRMKCEVRTLQPVIAHTVGEAASSNTANTLHDLSSSHPHNICRILILSSLLFLVFQSVRPQEVSSQKFCMHSLFPVD